MNSIPDAPAAVVPVLTEAGGSEHLLELALDRDEAGAVVVDLDGAWLTPSAARALAASLLALADEAELG